ncbi:MAG TPA: 16S rRNA (cytosine(967)-C(5))-methyltransferase RsmB [Elusimicrobiota bacterium]|nr:16S rRNA (cytosine(967)-C(5))-methyltransferase RsmB [Elusimicrobiota bacterium]
MKIVGASAAEKDGASARSAALAVLNRWGRGGGDLRTILADVLRKGNIPPQDRAFCRDLAAGTICRLNSLDWILDSFLNPPQRPLQPIVRWILRLGTFQLVFMTDRVPAYAAVNESVKLAGKAAAGFVNGVLRAVERGRGSLPWPDEQTDRVLSLSLKYSHPEWFVRRWLDRLGLEECRSFLEKNNQSPPMTVRVNTLRVTRDDLQKQLEQQGVAATPSSLTRDALILETRPSLLETEAFHKGYFIVQDEASQIVADLLEPEPGETILDVCAAPGGKTTHLAQRMENRGKVLAVDVSRERLRLVEENCVRLGVGIAVLLCGDARKLSFRDAAFDRVLLDAACSGLGVLRRWPDVRWNKKPEDIAAQLAPTQKELLKNAARCVKPGGTVVYSVCTLELEETEAVMGHFLGENPDFEVDHARSFLPSVLAGAVSPEGYVRLFPHRNGTDGFFIARLRRKG